MFEKLAKPVSKKSKSVVNLEQTVEFLECVIENGFRLSYAGFAVAARVFGEDSSTQIPAQRGSALVKTLPLRLQPFVCRKSGTYAKGLEWKTETPDDLRDRPVITKDEVIQATEEWLESLED